MAAKTEIKGLKDTLARLKQMGEEIDDKTVKPILVKEGDKIAASMKSRVRESTGRLKRSIKVIRPDKYENVIIIGPDFTKDGKGTMTIAALAAVNEFGTRDRKPRKKEFLQFQIDGKWVRTRMAKAVTAHPFIRPAFDQHKESAPKNINDAIIKVVDEKAKKLNLK